MDTWDIVILVVVAFLAVTTLVRLMIRHRDYLVARFRRQMTVEKTKHKDTEKLQQRDQAA